MILNALSTKISCGCWKDNLRPRPNTIILIRVTAITSGKHSEHDTEHDTEHSEHDTEHDIEHSEHDTEHDIEHSEHDTEHDTEHSAHDTERACFVIRTILNR